MRQPTSPWVGRCWRNAEGLIERNHLLLKPTCAIREIIIRLSRTRKFF